MNIGFSDLCLFVSMIVNIISLTYTILRFSVKSKIDRKITAQVSPLRRLFFT